MPIVGVFIKKAAAYEPQVDIAPRIKVSGQYLVWDQQTMRIKADGVYVAGTGVAPTNLTLPVLTAPDGSDVGDILVVTPGTWDGTPAPTIHYRWYADGVPLIGELGPTLLLTTAQAGHTITVDERATNTLGTVSATALESFPVPALTGFSSGFSPGFGA